MMSVNKFKLTVTVDKIVLDVSPIVAKRQERSLSGFVNFVLKRYLKENHSDLMGPKIKSKKRTMLKKKLPKKKKRKVIMGR